MTFAEQTVDSSSRGDALARLIIIACIVLVVVSAVRLGSGNIAELDAFVAQPASDARQAPPGPCSAVHPAPPAAPPAAAASGTANPAPRERSVPRRSSALIG